MLRLSSMTESKINNNENGFSIDVNVNDNDKLQSLMMDLSVRDDSEPNSFKDDLLNMIEGGQNEVVWFDFHLSFFIIQIIQGVKN